MNKQLEEFLLQYETAVEAMGRMTSKHLPAYHQMFGYACALRYVLETLGALDQAKVQWKPTR